MTDDVHPLNAWMRQHRIGWICAVSPHLDDAAFSIATFLALPSMPPREVWTVFSATTADGDAAYAKATGFAGPLEEFEARRLEDQEAMRLLGVPYRHVGAVASAFGDAQAQTLAKQIDDAGVRYSPQRALVLLPAGAGVEPTAWQRVWGRVRRQPVGCRSHSEHERVRDSLAAALLAAQAPAAQPSCVVGYYAELPYLWSQGPQRLHRQLQAQVSQPLLAFSVAANVDFKLDVARAYRSQLEPELGDRTFFQRRTLASPEWLFVPERT